MIGEEPTDEPGVDFSGSLWERMSEVELALEDEEELLRSSGGVSGSPHWTGVALPSLACPS